MKVALVYDRVNKFGGAERVLMALSEIYPNAPLYTLVYDKKGASWAKHIKVVPTFLNKISFLRSRHEILAPIASFAFETFNFSQFDLVISVTSSDAKSIITSPYTKHVCLCLTPTRYLWEGSNEYKNDWKLRILPKVIFKYFRKIDLIGSTRPDLYISISKEVQKRVKKYYKRDSEVVYPPIEKKFYSKRLVNKKSDYYLVVSRLVPYKKIDLVVEVFNKLNLPLIIVGSGSESSYLKSIASNNISFLGQISDKKLISLYRKAKCIVFPQVEDFGLVPLEAQATGCPVVAYAKGGALETVINGVTGIFFEKQSTTSLAKAIKRFQRIEISPAACRQNAKRFSKKEFKLNITRTIATHLQS